MTTRPYVLKLILAELSKVAITADYRDDGRYVLLHRLVSEAVSLVDKESLTVAAERLPGLAAHRGSNNLPEEERFFRNLSQKCLLALLADQKKD